MNKFKITSEFIKLENDVIYVDEKGLKEFYKWELDECIQNGANGDESLEFLYKEKVELKNNNLSIDYIIDELIKLDYKVERV